MPQVQNGERAITPALLSIPASGQYLGLSPASIYRLIGLGKLKAVKAGGKTLITMASLQSYAASLPPAKIKAPTSRRMAERPTPRDRRRTSPAD